MVGAAIAAPFLAPAQAAMPTLRAGSASAVRSDEARLEPRIVNGVLTSGLPAVAAVLTPANPASAATWCSATLIGCETVLTAAHCVCPTSGASCQSGTGAPDPGDFVVFLQHAGFFAVADIDVHPDYAFPVADVAVLKLAAPVPGIPPVPINTLSGVPFGTAGTIAGFGRAGGLSFDYGLKRVGEVETAACGAGVSDVTSVCWEFASPIGPPGTDSNTCNGDSGGPLFVDIGDGVVVAGITSGGSSSSCTAFDQSYDASVYEYRDYIADKGGADIENVSCGAGSQVGDDVVVTGFSGSVSSGVPTQVHSFSVPAGAQRLVVTMNASEAGGSDFDLYVKHGSPPTPASHDCKADGEGQFGACAFGAPAAGTWWVRVDRFSGGGTYQVTASVFPSPCDGTPSGEPCDDGNACTSGDACTVSGCVGAPVADGSACDDGRACTHEDACSAGSCAGLEQPLASCKAPVAAHAARLLLRRASHPSRDSLTFTWRRGDALSIADFGDPVAGDPVAFCLYDESAGASSVAVEIPVEAPDGWKTTKTGYRYRDRTRLQAGTDAIDLRAGVAGRSSATFKARGLRLALPALPLAQDGAVTAQLLTSNACVTATFSASQANLETRFRARSD
jgi:hypothetical protein